MRFPALLIDLLEELREENLPGTVSTLPGAKMVLIIDDPAKGEIRYEFDGKDCKNLLASRDTVERFYEALRYPEEVSVELHALNLDQDVLEKLENTFSTVDEF